DPHALLDQGIRHTQELPRLRPVEAVERYLEPGDPLALDLDAGLAGLIGFEQRGAEAAQDRPEPAQQLPRVLRLLVQGDAHTEAELRVVLEQGVGPGRPA